MRIEFFALPEKTFLDFYDVFVLEKEERRAVCSDAFLEELKERGMDFDGWYDTAPLFERLSPDLLRVSMKDALRLLEKMEGKVLFLSEPLQNGPLGGLTVKGRVFYDYVAMTDPASLAEQIASEWAYDAEPIEGRAHPKTEEMLTKQEREVRLPADLYVFDPYFERLLVFTHRILDAPDGKSHRLCKAFGFDEAHLAFRETKGVT